MLAERSSVAASAAIAIAIAVAIFPSTADAFCRTRTIVPPPERDLSACFEGGLALYHPSQCVTYRLRTTESPLIPNAALSSSLGRAFRTWAASNGTCAPGFEAIELAATPDTEIVGYKTGEHGNNVIGVVDGPWPHGGGDTLALTTLTFNADSGEVYDADVEITSEVPLSLGDTPPADGYDFDAVITHEVGHFLGLAHSAQSDAAMFPSYTPGSISQRTLGADDAAGVCAVYPTKASRLASTGLVASTACPAPAVSAASALSGGADPGATSSCAVGSATGSDAAAPSRVAFLAGALGLLAMVARRSRRERSKARIR